MHGKGVPEVEFPGRSPILEEFLQPFAEIMRGVDTQDLTGVGGIPPREEGHLKPLVTLLSLHIFRAIIGGVIVHLFDHLDKTSEPSGCARQ